MLHPSNKLLILVTNDVLISDKSINSIELHPENINSIFDIDKSVKFEKFNDFNKGHPENIKLASIGSLELKCGKLISSKEVQLLNIELIFVRESVIISDNLTDFKLIHPANIYSIFDIDKLKFERSIDFNIEHPENI